MDKLGEEIEKLGRNPEKKPLVDDEPWRSEGIRHAKVEHYLVYFRIDVENAAVHVIAIVYEKREQKRILAKLKKDG